ncbi:MAG: DUF4249 domain-containing protein [Chitinophagaceae bacterium]
MRKFERIHIVYALLFFMFTQCKKPFEPAVLTRDDNYLVVDGFINTSPGGITTIILSRTKNLTDTVVNIPEHGAKAVVQNAAGISYPLQETGTNGNYISNPITLDNNGQYKIVITTADNNQYQSDLVTAKKTPAIDSVAWRQGGKGVNLYVNTHDPANNTRYYRWEYIQTWEYHSQLETIWGVANGLAYLRTPAEQVHICYNTTMSSDILTGTSAALSQDVISDGLLGTILQNDSTLQYRSSFLVRQYALTPAAYFYWQIIQKNSAQLGTLFDLQPSQLEGNIHSLTNANEPVVGYMSATTLQEKRIAINNSDLQNWQSAPGSYNCTIADVPQNPANFLIVDYPDTSYAPWYYVSMGPLKLGKKVCLDCTLSGGVNVKPSFW